LLADIERTWTALNQALESFSEAQMTALRDPEGWSVKDHLIHLEAWERSVVFFLQGKPRHEGLGVDQAVYLTRDMDRINAVVQKQRRELPLADALAQMRSTHGQLLKLLEPLSDADLQRTYRHYLPDEPGEGEGPTALRVIVSNTSEHYTEHLEWIEALVQ
jgi:hypothetical protein